MYKSTYLFSLSNVFKLKKEKQSKQTQYTIFYIKLIKLKQGKKKKEDRECRFGHPGNWATCPCRWGGKQAAVESKKNKNVNREEKSGVCVEKKRKEREKERKKERR